MIPFSREEKKCLFVLAVVVALFVALGALMVANAGVKCDPILGKIREDDSAGLVAGVSSVNGQTGVVVVSVFGIGSSNTLVQIQGQTNRWELTLAGNTALANMISNVLTSVDTGLQGQVSANLSLMNTISNVLTSVDTNQQGQITFNSALLNSISNIFYVISTNLQDQVTTLDGKAFKTDQSNYSDDGMTNRFYTLECKGVSGHPIELQTITAASTINMTNWIVSVTSAADVEITNAPALKLATKAPYHTMRGIHNEGDYTIIIPDTNTVSGSGFCGGGSDFTLESGEVGLFIWHGNKSCWELATRPAEIIVEADFPISIRNQSGSIIAEGQALAYAGFSYAQNRILVKKADADDTTARPCIGILDANLANNRNGFMISFGEKIGFNTSAFTTNVPLYLSTDPNTTYGLTETRPTGTGTIVQVVGICSKSHAQGELLIYGINEERNPNRVNCTELYVSGGSTFKTNLIFDMGTELRWQTDANNYFSIIGQSATQGVTRYCVSGVISNKNWNMESN